MLPQAVSRLFSICKCCGKGNCKKATVGSRGGPGMAAIFGPGDQLFSSGQSGGTTFKGGLSTA